jgi:hypothetical protein
VHLNDYALLANLQCNFPLQSVSTIPLAFQQLFEHLSRSEKPDSTPAKVSRINSQQWSANSFSIPLKGRNGVI